jgi:hypothetical protein
MLRCCCHGCTAGEGHRHTNGNPCGHRQPGPLTRAAGTPEACNKRLVGNPRDTEPGQWGTPHPAPPSKAVPGDTHALTCTRTTAASQVLAWCRLDTRTTTERSMVEGAGPGDGQRLTTRKMVSRRGRPTGGQRLLSGAGAGVGVPHSPTAHHARHCLLLRSVCGDWWAVGRRRVVRGRCHTWGCPLAVALRACTMPAGAEREPCRPVCCACVLASECCALCAWFVEQGGSSSRPPEVAVVSTPLALGVRPVDCHSPTTPVRHCWRVRLCVTVWASHCVASCR